MKKTIIGLMVTSVSLVTEAVTPTAYWDCDFSEKEKSGITLTVGSGNAEADDHSSIAVGSTIGVGLGWPSGLSAVTVVVKYSGMTTPSDGYRSFVNVKKSRDDGSVLEDGCSPGVCCDSDAKTQGEWYSSGSTRPWTGAGVTEGTYPVGDASGCFAFVYDPGGAKAALKGTTLLKREGNTWSVIYRSSGLLAGYDVRHIIGVSVGGPNADLSGTAIKAFDGLKVESVALFDSSLTADELATFLFPSETGINTATLTDAGSPYRWSDLVWSLGTAPSQSADRAIISVAGNVTLNMDVDSPIIAEMTIKGSGSLALTGSGRLGANKLSTDAPVTIGSGDTAITISSGISFLSGGSLGDGSLAVETAGTVNGDVSGPGALRVSSGRILFLGALNQTGGTFIESGAMAVVTNGTFGAGSISGLGVACFRNVLPDEATRANFQMSTWQGTCRLEALNEGIKNLDANLWGTASSKVCFAGVPETTYFPNRNFTVLPEVILDDIVENGVRICALNIDNGYTDYMVTFSKLSGTGTLNADYSTTPSHIIRATDGSNFHGSIRVQKLRVIFGTGPLPAKAKIRDCGQIIISDDAAVEIARNASWYSMNEECGVFIYGKVRCNTGAAFAYDANSDIEDQVYSSVNVLASGALEMYMTAAEGQDGGNPREFIRDYTWLTGEGQIVLTDDGDVETYRGLPTAANMWASTLSVSNAQTYGLLLLSESSATSLNPQVYQIKNLSGNGGFNSNQPPHGENRSIRVTQSVSTVWGGVFDKFTHCDNVVGMSVAGAAGVESKTLTLTGENITTNVLTIEASGSVRLDGTWVGDIAVDGEFGGNGYQKDGVVTFSTGSSLAIDANAGGLNLANMASWPTTISVNGSADPSLVKRVTLLTSAEPLPNGFKDVTVNLADPMKTGWRVFLDRHSLSLRRNIGLLLLLK